VDDVLVHPFRRVEVLSKLFLFQRILQWDELAQVSEGFGEVLKRLHEDLELAIRLQKTRAPVRFPEVKGLKVASRYLAGLKPGGDHFDLADSRDGSQLSFLLSDSSSHGLASAVLSALMNVALKLSADEARSTRETVRKIYNEVLAALSDRDHLSLFYGVLSRKDYRLRYLNLGHSRAFHAPAGKLFQELPAQGPAISRSRMLGEPLEAEIQLEPKDRLVLLSDGFLNVAGGVDAARKLLDEFRDREPQDALNELAFKVKSRFKDPDDLPEQDCTAIITDVDGKILRLAR
jgi:serine phosphatase RsbU (regulator of sigma subunit)